MKRAGLSLSWEPKGSVEASGTENALVLVGHRLQLVVDDGGDGGDGGDMIS